MYMYLDHSKLYFYFWSWILPKTMQVGGKSASYRWYTGRTEHAQSYPFVSFLHVSCRVTSQFIVDGVLDIGRTEHAHKTQPQQDSCL